MAAKHTVQVWLGAALVALIGMAPGTPAVAQVPAAPGIPASTLPAKASAAADTTALAKEAQGWLIDLIRINTTNPPGNEQVAAKYIAAILQKEGVTSELLDLEPGRSALVARLQSSAVADPSRALLLVAHMDVVGVNKSRWTVDPFGGIIKDGYIWGR